MFLFLFFFYFWLSPPFHWFKCNSMVHLFFVYFTYEFNGVIPLEWLE